ncbi:MAG: exodeoxyribonuclease V subunit gamma, partial [Deltaproteobacteria bacterium]|nr:exodeoxyribonuclease V subunit gamma [Deltaproteobacteria bacterium]
MDLTADLSEPQRRATLHGDGPLLVLAGAGSGKTRVITYRIAHLVADRDVAPWRILAVTFTNKAAGEMRERARKLLGPDAAQVWLGTFHSTCARLLRRHPEAVGLGKDFSIYDDDDSRALVTRILKEKNVDPNYLAPRDVQGIIDRAKQDGRGPDALPRRGTRDETAAEIYAEYDKRLRTSNSADFGDLLVLAAKLLAEHDEVREELRRRFLHLLVDEFQDTNRIQFRLMQLLVNDQRNVCVVGDDDQSIYRWRGAEVKNILEFEKHYPGTVTVRLEQNYRSTAHVLAAASAVVKRNEARHPKELWTANPPGDPVRVVLAGDEREEAGAVVRLVQAQRAEGIPLARQAVFYRVNAQSRVLEEALRGHGIPYVVIGGFRFFERAEVKDLLAYLRLLVNPADEAGFLRVVNVPPRGIGKVSVERLAAYARDAGKPLSVAAAEAGDIPGLPAAGGRALTALAGQLSTWRETLIEGPQAVARRVFEDSGLEQALRDDRAPEAENRLQNVRELVGSIGDWAKEHEAPTLSAYLEHVTLQTAIDELDENAADRLALMTVHSAKGLEFDAVYVVGVEDGLFPYRRRNDEIDRHEERARLEEERRLAYVAMTRARRLLWLFHARRRMLFGGTQTLPPSRFLSDLPPGVVEEAILPGAKEQAAWSLPSPERRPAWGRSGPPATSRQPRADAWDDQLSPTLEQEIRQSVVEEAGTSFRVGDKVRHARFGIGKVVDIESGAEVKLS